MKRSMHLGIRHRSKKWWRRIFYYLPMASSYNSYVLARESNPEEVLEQYPNYQEYFKVLALELIGDNVRNLLTAIDVAAKMSTKHSNQTATTKRLLAFRRLQNETQELKAFLSSNNDRPTTSDEAQQLIKKLGLKYTTHSHTLMMVREAVPPMESRGRLRAKKVQKAVTDDALLSACIAD